MVGKPIKGKSFGGCVRYVVNKKEATVLTAEGISVQNAATIIRDFNFQRQLNPALGKAVGHTVLSWSEKDKPQLTNKRMIEMAQQYMEKMGITSTQYLIVKHTDRQHPHVHIIFNRVDNNGKTITDKNDHLRNVKVCRELTESYGLHIAADKQSVNRGQLKGNDKVRYAIYDALKETLPRVQTWDQLERALQRKGIALQFKYKSGTKQVQGVSFERDGVVFKGSAIDRSMSIAGIEKQLRQNQAARREADVEAKHKRGYTMTPPGDTGSTIHPETVQPFHTGIELAAEVASVLGSLLPSSAEHQPEEQPHWLQQRKRKKGKRHL
jgi:hypothetical protein